MKNQLKLNSSKEIIAFLVKRFPNCFIAKGETRPLKIGILQDIMDRLTKDDGISKTKLRFALRIYTSSWRYLYGVKEGVKRIDLDGNDCGDLESEHVKYVHQQLMGAKNRIYIKKIEKKSRIQALKQKLEKIDNKKNLSIISGKRSELFFSKTKEINKNNQHHFYSKNQVKKNQNKKIVDLTKLKSVTDLSALKIGQVLKVIVGHSIVDASVLKISKDGVRVQLVTGLAMIVRAEHLKL